MTLSSILLGAALLILTGVYLARPFLQKDDEAERPLTQRERLLNTKEAILAEIRQTDFDFETGKIPADVHEQERAFLMQQAADVLRQIDEYDAHPNPVDTEIEAAVARIRRQGAPATAAASAAVAANGKAKFCPQCGSPVDPGDKFCTSCGHKLAAVVLTPQT
ncbi:MAG TPA: zinc ribbon domain-containing protein [Anaerolineae bacterium]|nr:zinc ribbon domain-containing protein [Anaerolineae bacterium]